MAEEKRLVDFSVFKKTRSYETLTGLFEIDSVHQLMRFVPSNGMEPIYMHFQDVLDADVIMTDCEAPTNAYLSETELEENKDEKDEHPYFSEFYLYVTLKDPERTNVRIPFIFQKTLKTSALGKRAVEDSYSVRRWVRGSMKEPVLDTAYATEEEIRRQEELQRKQEDHSSVVSWTCPRCSYINLGIRSICMSCGISRAEAIREEGGVADVNAGRPLVRFSVFETSKSCEMLTGIFEVDTVHQLVRYTSNNGGYPVYAHYRDILDVEVVQKNTTVTRDDDVPEDEKTEDIYMVEFYLYVMLSLSDREAMRIPFIFQRTLKDSVLGRRAVNDSNIVKRWLRDAMHEPSRETAFADEEDLAEMERAEKDPYGWNCPHCSYRNRAVRTICLSCGYNTVKNK